MHFSGPCFFGFVLHRAFHITVHVGHTFLVFPPVFGKGGLMITHKNPFVILNRRSLDTLVALLFPSLVQYPAVIRDGDYDSRLTAACPSEREVPVEDRRSHEFPENILPFLLRAVRELFCKTAYESRRNIDLPLRDVSQEYTRLVDGRIKVIVDHVGKGLDGPVIIDIICDPGREIRMHPLSRPDVPEFRGPILDHFRHDVHLDQLFPHDPSRRSEIGVLKVLIRCRYFPCFCRFLAFAPMVLMSRLPARPAAGLLPAVMDRLVIRRHGR